jgi:hypothetical protein
MTPAGAILYRLPIRRVRVRNEHINGIMDFEVNHSRVTGNPEVTSSPVGLVPTNACIDWSGHVLGGRLIGNYARVLRSLL